MRDVQVMLLAAGLGTRLWPITAHRGKPAVPFMGRPLIRGMFDWLAKHGAQRFVVNTHHCAESIHAALDDLPSSLSVSFSHEQRILGTAGSLAYAVQQGLLDPNRTTLVVNAKLVTDIDLTAAFETHRQQRAHITMVLRTNHQREAFTSVRVQDDRVVGFGPNRVPEGPNPKLFTGIHFFEPRVIARAEPRFSDSIRDLYPAEMQTGKVRAHIDDHSTWAETSTLERYLSLQLAQLGSEANLQAKNAIIDSKSKVKRSILESNVAINAANVTNSVLLSGAQVGDGAQVDHVVLGERVCVPAGMKLHNQVVVRDDRASDPPENVQGVTKKDGLIFVRLSL